MKRLKIKRGTWDRDRGTWVPVYYHNFQSQPGLEVQSYAFGDDGKTVHAGVSRHTHINQAVANQIQRIWERWRREYRREVTPLRDDPRVVRLVLFPVDQPEKAQSFTITGPR